ncbi:MAG: hypothetical protein K0Q92_426 [Steroidobacteraceae bacterium]|nr:hypothetical protein [Steroidobacteraceae bacterium]
MSRVSIIALWCALAMTQAFAQDAPTPGGAYIGYYQESPVTNPEDPVPGAIYLRLPATDGAFSGDMYFTYVGCQSSNVGSVSGRKSGAALSGNWSGSVDDSAQRGAFTGSFDAANGFYTGTYDNAGGKQHRDLSPCIEYYIAPGGTWALFPVERNHPAGFEIRVTPNAARWARNPQAGGSLVTIFDAAMLASAQGNAIVSQTLLDSDSHIFSLSQVTLVRGREYVLSVAVIDASAERLAFGSRRFVAQ